MAKDGKTNAMRILEKNHIEYEHFTYDCDEFVSGIEVADRLGLPYEKVYKTLVTESAGKSYYVFVLPIAEELDLKKAARSVGEKSLHMIPVKEIEKVTGYIRGGCTAIGMKKQFVTRIDSSAKVQEKMIISGGRRGLQLALAPDCLLKAAGAEYADLTV